MRIDIRWKLFASQFFPVLVTIGVLYVYLWLAMGITGKGIQAAFVIALAVAACASLLFS